MDSATIHRQRMLSRCTVVATHSGETSMREWDADYSMWLFPGDCIVKDESGRTWKIHAQEMS